MAEGKVDYEGRLADVYDRGRHLLPEAEAAWLSAVEPHLTAARLVLDIGAGTGRFANLFAERFDIAVVGVEPAAAMRARVSGVSVVAGRAEALPLRKDAADVAWLSCVVHHLDLAATGRELARVLRPGGCALVRSTFPDQFDELEWLRWFPSGRAVDETRMPSLEQIESAWAPSGLELEARSSVPHLMAADLFGLAERLRHRAISTLELISDEEFEAGMAALERAARTEAPAPVYAPASLVVFRAI